MSAAAAPQHCPYCAGLDLHPHGQTHGAWECRECLRAFAVRLVAHRVAPPSVPGARGAS